MSNLSKDMFEDLMDKGWLETLWPFLSSEKGEKIFSTLRSKKKFEIIYPTVDNVFNAFKYTPWEDVRVVIIGQDPYHDGSADGLCFSAGNPKQGYCPPSLRNILLEVEDDIANGLHINRKVLYDLKGWAQQGVLLINTAFTVKKASAGSHAKLWKPFTEYVLKVLNERKSGVIYLLWGNHAKSYKSMINEKSNIILEAGHPSPLNTKHPFKGCKHFSKANEIITRQNGPEYTIDWTK